MINSLRFRLFIIGGLLLLLFVGLTGAALTGALDSYARQAEFQRLQGMVYGLLAATEVDERGQVQLDERAQPELRLRQPGSGLYAWVLDAQGRVVWQSLGAGQVPPLLNAMPEVGEWRFDFSDQPRLAFGFEWQQALNTVFGFTLLVSDAASPLQAQRSAFSSQLWWWLLGAALLLLLMLLLLFAWGLAPLKSVVAQLERIKRGQQEQLHGRVPQEIRPLTQSVNALLHQERQRQQRYKNSMADLAHSLKTPLAILKSGRVNAQEFDDQIQRIDQIVSYQLQRASATGGAILHPPLALRPGFSRTVAALQKVYADKALQFDLWIAEDLTLAMEQGDLLEIAGNLLDNAARFARSRVEVRAARDERGLLITVADDGPGFPGQAAQLLRRGARADTLAAGQGIGLATVQNLMEAYAGRISLARSASLLGAEVTLDFPALG